MRAPLARVEVTRSGRPRRGRFARPPTTSAAPATSRATWSSPPSADATEIIGVRRARGGLNPDSSAVCCDFPADDRRRIGGDRGACGERPTLTSYGGQHRRMTEATPPRFVCIRERGKSQRPQTNRSVAWSRIDPLVGASPVSRRDGSCRCRDGRDHQIDHEVDFGRWQRPTPGVVVLQHRRAVRRAATVDRRPARRPGCRALAPDGRQACGTAMGRQRHDRRADAQGRPGRTARRLLLPPDPSPLRPLGEAGGRAATAAARARRAAGGRARPATYAAPSGCWQRASSRG